MKTNWVYKVVKFLKKIYFKNDRRVVAWLVCVGIATGFWFLNALSKTYTVDMTVPVNYINLPNNKTLANQLPDQFDLKIRAHGFTILRHQAIFFFVPLEFNVNEMTENRMTQSKRNNYAFPVRQFLTELSYQLSNELEIVSMNPDTLYFKFDKLEHKRLKIKPLADITIKRQFKISGNIVTKPDSVTVNGAQSVLDTLQFISTEIQHFNAVDKVIDTDAPLKKIKDTYFETSSVRLIVPVEEYTESQLAVSLIIRNKPNDVIIKLFPEKVKVTFQVGLSRFQEMNPDDFKCSVDYNDIAEGKPKLKITFESIPQFLYELKNTPEEIEYLIEN